VHSGSVTEGLHLADRARRRADPINDTMVGSLVALGGSALYRHLGSPRESQGWCTSELAKPRTANAVRRAAPNPQPRNYNTPLVLHNELVIACIRAGELEKAWAHLAEIDSTRKPYELLFFEGERELAAKRLTAHSERSLATGNRLEELEMALLLARLRKFTREHAQAAQFLQRALEISVDGGDILQELIARSSLAMLAADTDGDALQALPQLQ